MKTETTNSFCMNLKNELFRVGILLLSAVLFVGLLNEFSLSAIDIQLHDTYYVIHPLYGILFFCVVLLLLRYTLFVLAVFCLKHRIAAFAFKVVLLCVILFLIAFFLQLSHAYIAYNQRYPNYPSVQRGTGLLDKSALAFVVLYVSVMAVFVSTIWQFWQKSPTDK